MNQAVRFLVGMLASLLVFAVPGIAVAQEKGKATVKVLIDNDKVRVTETHYRPGDVGEDDRSHFRVNRTLQGGTLERIYPDGKKEKLELKTGQVRYLEPSKAGNYQVKNIGKTTVVNYIVRVK